MVSPENNTITPGRYFFALSPDANSRMQIQHIMKRLPDDPTLKLQTTANLHQTLLFLGELDQTQLNTLLENTSSISSPVIEMKFDHLTFWEEPKIFCLTSRLPSIALYQLVNRLQEIAARAGIKIDEKPYRPHITLARKARESIILPIAPVRFKAEQLILMKSVSTEHGPQYQPVRQWPIVAV